MPGYQGLGARGTTMSTAKTQETPRYHTLLSWGLILVWAQVKISQSIVPQVPRLTFQSTSHLLPKEYKRAEGGGRAGAQG